jgi:D-methionine transport system ATP-binding protein
VLLCDEATSALDPQTTQSILALLQRLNRELGITIVVITHEMAVIKKICHRVAVMENGEVVEENDVLSLFADPKKQITRDFLRTTSNLSGIYPLVEADAPITRLQPGELLLLMRYGKTEVSQPLISRMTLEFGLAINILFGDLEIIGTSPMGGTVAIFHGAPEAIAGALQFLKDEHISVEVIRDARSA